MSATLVDMGAQDGRGDLSDKDADFSAYMSARQPALYRTAYLLAGDHAGAEDLLQLLVQAVTGPFIDGHGIPPPGGGRIHGSPEG